MKEILTIKTSQYDNWSAEPSTLVSGNQTIEQYVERIEHGLQTRSDKPWDFYVWRAKGKTYLSEDGASFEECDRWHLSGYEVVPCPPENRRYQAIVLLYYSPVANAAIAV